MGAFVKHEKNAEIDTAGPFPASLLMKKAINSTFSFKKGILKKGGTIKEHMHDNVDQFEYIVSGKAIFYVEGLGDNELSSGSYSYVPRGIKHSIKLVEDDLEIINIFSPANF